MAALATARRDDELCSDDGKLFVQQATKSSPVRRDREDLNAVDFLREAEKNRRQIEKLEKEQTLNTLCRKHGCKDVCEELEEYEKLLERERNAQKTSLQKQLAKIHNGVRKFQRHLTVVKSTPELIEKLQEIMSEVEISIHNLKEEQFSCFEGYLKEERICRQEVNAYEKKIENWSLALKSNPKLPTASSLKTKLQDRDLPEEVRDLEYFLQKTGGPHGGWDQFDHQVFLRIWTKHSGQPSYRKEAKLYLPGKSQEEIKRHEDWHQELLRLKDKKRECILHWKASKHRELQTRIQSQQETEEAQHRERKARSLAEQHRTEEEKMEAAQRLKEWREEKKRKEEHEEEQRLAEEFQKRKQEKEERRRQLEVKIALEEHLRLKREKEEEEKSRRREEQQRKREERQREAAKMIRSFSERDLHKVEAKLHEKQMREKEEEERRRRITAKLKEKVDGHVNRDPSRLNCLTEGWQERMKYIGPSGEGPLLKMFHRAIPTWRQGL